MEYCAGGDLRGTLNLCYNASGLDQRSVLAIISDLTSALGYLHNRRIIHRDLKPVNRPRLRQETRPELLGSNHRGNAPVPRPRVYMGNQYTKSVDYWSLGLITHEIVTGLRPFLPDYPPGKWMEVVENKGRDTICIPDKGEERKLTSWLQSLLEWDALLRGKNEVSDDITVFSELSSILNRRRLKVVLMDSSYNKFDFVLEAGSSLEALVNRIEEQSRIPRDSLILLSGNGNRFLSLQPFMGEEESIGCPLIFALDARIVTDIERKISAYGIQIPHMVKIALKSPKEKLIIAQRSVYMPMDIIYCARSLKSRESPLWNAVMNTSLQGLTKIFEKAVTKFDLHQESLQYDMEKYMDQAQRRQRITSAKIFDSWSNPDPNLEKQLKDINADMTSFECEAKRINTEIRSLQKSSSLTVNSSPEIKELCAKSLSLCESLRAFSSTSGRPSESSNVVEMARLIVVCLKRRDDILRRHFTLLNTLLSLVNALNLLIPKMEMTRNKLEIFLVSVSRSQRKRQSDVWKLLSAALQLSPGSVSTPTTSSAGAAAPEHGVDETSQLIGEQRILRSNLQRALDSTTGALDKFNQLM
ncbi:Uncharacterized protein FKW44_000126 [Caligus rogercresseyi]|uniref:Protein kinase domain-containing protein n=1 Tax=Caligus rogercresseyi TaxID=217165 RepID=A0A7T8KGV1_CALRO|nr:Uncharacterized protein FKW44_000126 [Caligus rogercresseyi]